MPFLTWRWNEQVYTVGSAVALLLFLLMIFSVPPDPKSLSLDLFNSDNRFVKFLIKPPEEKEEEIPEWLKKKGPDEQGGKGKRHKGEEGKMGKKTSKNKEGLYGLKGPKDNPDPHLAKKLAEEQAKNAGILGVLKMTEGSHIASIFGRDTALGNDAEDVLGGLIGNQIGEAYGVGGLGLVGTGSGGGGTGEGTIGLGNLGTIGKGGGGGNGSGYGRGAGGLGGRRAKAPDVIPGQANVRGSLDKEIIRRIIRRHINEVKYCYEQELTKKPDLGGRIMVQFTIAASGQVIASVLQNSTMGNARVENCIVQAVRRWEFPKPLGGGIVIVSYPFVLTPAGGGARVAVHRHGGEPTIHDPESPPGDRRCDAGLRWVRLQPAAHQGHRAGQPRRREFKNNLYDSAEQELKQAIQTDPTYEIAHYNLGKVYQKQRKWDKAIEAFEAAAQREPDNANYQYDLGEAYLEAKKIEQAREGAARRRPSSTPSCSRRSGGWGWSTSCSTAPRRRTTRPAPGHRGQPARSTSRTSRSGYLYLDYDAAKEAAQVFQSACAPTRTSGECHNGYGLALKDLKQYEQATTEFKKAIDLEPGLYDALYNAGMTYSDWYDEAHGNDHKERAREYLQKFVANGGSKDGGFGYVKAANDKLYALSGSVASAPTPDRSRSSAAIGDRTVEQRPRTSGRLTTGVSRSLSCF